MRRLVVPKPNPANPTAASNGSADDATTRVIKYIPAEVISGYMLLAGLVDAASKVSPLHKPAGWMVFILGTILTPLYLWKTGRPTGVQVWHLPISTVSFVLWAYALGGPFVEVKLFGFAYESWFAALLAGAFSWGVALAWSPTES